MLIATLTPVFETLGVRFHPAWSSRFLAAITLADRERRTFSLLDYPCGVGYHSLSVGITVTRFFEFPRTRTTVPGLAVSSFTPVLQKTQTFAWP